jgi:hypothetical protein
LLALIALLTASASADNFVYTPSSLPTGTVGMAYDVTLSVTTADGQAMDLGTATTLTSSTQAAPGIFVKQVKVNGHYALHLIGKPTKAGAFPFATCVIASDASCGPKSWTLVIGGAKEPGWVKRAKSLKLVLEQELRFEHADESLLTDYEFAKADKKLEPAAKLLAEHSGQFHELERIVAPGSPARAEIKAAAADASGASNLDASARQASSHADAATGKNEKIFRDQALHYVERANTDKLHAIAALERAIASAG